MNRKEFRINKFLELKLIDKRTHIYVNGKLFNQCKYLLFNLDKKDAEQYEEIKSIDDAVQKLDHSHERGGSHLISPETEFWGHCSNLQVWHDNNYDTRLLHSNLAFPLLKELANGGDPRARRAFKEEIACRFEDGLFQTKALLVVENYLDLFTKEELETLFLANNERLRMQVMEILENKDPSIKRRHVMNFLIYFIRLGDIEAKRIFTKEMMDHLTFEGYSGVSIRNMLMEGYPAYLEIHAKKEIIIRALSEGTLEFINDLLSYPYFKGIPIDDESLFSPASHLAQIIVKYLFMRSSPSLVFSVLRKLHEGGSKLAKKLIETSFIVYFENVKVHPAHFYEHAEHALECLDKKERIELAQNGFSKIHAFLIIHFEILKKHDWLHFNEGDFNILIDGVIGVMDRVNDRFHLDDYHVIKLKDRKDFKKITIDNRVNYDFDLIRKDKTERYFLSNIHFRTAFSLLDKDSEGVLCIPKDPMKDSRFRMTCHEKDIVLYIAPKVLDFAGIIESSIRIKERMIQRIEKRRRVQFISILTAHLKDKEGNLVCDRCLWGALLHNKKKQCDFLKKRRPLLDILDDLTIHCKYKDKIERLGVSFLENRLTLSRTHDTYFKRQLKLIELKETFDGKKTVNLNIRDEEDAIKIKTNNIKDAVIMGRAFDKARKEIAEKSKKKEIKQKSKKSKIKQTSITDF